MCPHFPAEFGRFSLEKAPTFVGRPTKWVLRCTTCNKPPFELAGVNGPNLEGHIKQCTSPGNVGISGFMAPHVKPQPAIPLEVVCQGFHDCLVTFEGEQYDMTVLHTCPPSEQRNWYPIAEQRFAFAKQGEVITRTGTLKHRECKQVAVGPDNRPTGTYTCAACATLDPRRSREIRDLIRR